MSLKSPLLPAPGIPVTYNAMTSLTWSSLKVLCGVVITIGLLGWAMRDVSPTLVWSAIKEARLLWLALSMAAFLASFAVRALRWGTLLGGYPSAGFGIRHSATFIGFAGNCLFPARIGEIIRATVLHRYGSVPFATAIGSLIAERALDAMIITVLLLISIPAGMQSGYLNLAGLPVGWIGALIMSFCGSLVVIAHRPAWISRATEQVIGVMRIGSFTPRLTDAVNFLIKGIDVFQSPKRAMQATVEGLLLWALLAGAYWASMYSFGITAPGFTGAVFVSSVAAFGIAIPSSPGNFGPFEAAVRIALGVYAVPADAIIAYALTLHLLMYVSVTTIGIILAMRLGVSWSEIIRLPNLPKERALE